MLECVYPIRQTGKKNTAFLGEIDESIADILCPLNTWLKVIYHFELPMGLGCF